MTINNKQFHEESIAMEVIRLELKEITKKLDNHLVHVSADISQIKNDLDWIKRFFWLVAGTSITAIIGALLGLVLK